MKNEICRRGLDGRGGQGRDALPVSRAERSLRRLAIAITVMLVWLYIWVLVLKLCDHELLIGNYNNLKSLTLKERILWDLIPFNYRGDEATKRMLFVDSLLNCLILAPLGILLGYVFRKRRIWRDVALCLGFSLFIELLQMLTMLGNPAPEDLLTNTVGYFVGLALHQLLLRRLTTKQSVILFSVLTVICSAATLFSLFTTLQSIDLLTQILSKTL